MSTPFSASVGLVASTVGRACVVNVQVNAAESGLPARSFTPVESVATKEASGARGLWGAKKAVVPA